MSDIKDSIEDASDKLKAAAKAAVSKVKDPERDIETEYQKEKMKEGTLEKSESAETTTTTITPVTATTPVTTTPPVATTTTKISRLTPSSIPQYKRILVPHDESEMSDKALSHAIYLSNETGAEIVILNVIENIDKIPHTSISATMKEGEEKLEEIQQSKPFDTNLAVSLEGQVKQRMEEKLRSCREAGSKGQISYRIQTGKAVDEILKVSEEMNTDLIVMSSSKITSTIMGIIQQSTAKKVIESSNRPVLVMYEQQKSDRGT
jgi:nucleotide-binding universal stress UspA family protein